MASSSPTRRTRRAALALSATLVTTLGAAAYPATAAPASPSPARPAPVADAHTLAGVDESKLAGGLDRKSGSHAVFVQLAGGGAADAATVARSTGSASPAAAARSRRAAVARTAKAVLSTARSKDAGTDELFQVSNAVPGVALRADSAALRAVAARGDVVKVSPLVAKTVSNASAAQLTQVLQTWQATGNTGKGVRVGVIDTGLDYTHADFGGVGTVDAYNAALADETNPFWRDSLPALAKAKVAGGYDFVGDNYDANPAHDTYQPVPHPDKNPIDCGEHGTHVAGTVGGYGVTKDGKTFTGSYAKQTGSSLMNMKVGPGMAPLAKLYSLKVFGCEGSTDVVIPALDWALDPNGDGDFSDHLDIVNMSLGSDYGTVDDPENAVIDEIAKHGVLPVIAMGNNGDLTDTGGSPGNAVRSLAVASSVDALQLRDGLLVNAPSNVAGIAAGQVSVAYDWANNGPTHAPVTGDVVAIPGPDADGCKPLSDADAAKVNGKVAWLEWDDNDSTRRCGSAGRSANVRAAGAIGAIFTSKLDVFGAGITGDKTIPVFQLPKTQTDKLRPALDAGTLNVTFDGKYVATIKDVTPSITDTLSGFTSRGTHGSLGVVKPDVTAPGDTIASAKMGSGNDVLSISGTSMATPHTAGIAALVKAAHPGWTTEEIKAAVMNTAGHDLFTGPNRTGKIYGPNRVGAGRADARAATSTSILAYAANVPGAVSASFGVVPAPITSTTVTRRIPVTVRNTGRAAHKVTLSYAPVVSSPGVSYSVSPKSVVVRPHSKATATVTMTVTPAKLRHTIDPTMQVDQLDVPRQFVSDASGRLLVKPVDKPALRVPVYGAAKPAAKTWARAANGTIELTGTGVAQGDGAQRYESIASVLQLGEESADLPACTADQTGGCYYNQSTKSADLKYVGAGSDKDWLYFGISTRADWATIGNSVVPYVDFDTNGNGIPDYEVFVQNYPDTDLLLANLVDLKDTADPADDKVIDNEPVNFNFGDVDTNVFDTNVLLIPVLKEAIKAPAAGTTFPVTYKVGTADLNRGGDVDDTGLIRYDAGTPDVSTGAPIYSDQGNTAIDYALNGTAATDGGKALVLHLHGLPGNRAQVLDLPGSGQ